MQPATRALLWGIVLLALSVGLAIVSLFAIAVTAGKSIAAGERAAMLAGAVDVLIAFVASGLFFLVNRALGMLSRVLSTAALFILELVVLVPIFVMTLILLNR